MMKYVIAACVLLGACASHEDAVESTEATVEASEPMKLAGSEWRLEDNDNLFVRFEADGAVAASAGCNNMSGTYEQEGDALTVGPLRSTRMFCRDERGENERMLSGVLRQVRSVEADFKTLRMIDENGDTLLELQRADWD